MLIALVYLNLFDKMKRFVSGNIYLNNTNWLPAFHNCQLKCRIDSEICQMSGPIVRIRKQRCFELPLECRRNLKKFLGGAELFTKSNYRIWRNIVSSNLDKKVKMENKQNNSSKKLIKNLKNNLIKENKNINYLPLKEEFLLPLSQDNDILIPVDLLFNTKQQILKNKKKNNNKQKKYLFNFSKYFIIISTKLLLNTLSTPITPTTLKITQKHVNNIKNKIQQNYFELNNTENKIISNKFNNSSNLQRIEIFGPPIKSSNISHHQQLISKDSFIYQQPKQFQNKEEKQINDLKFKLIPPWWTFKK
ncbi:hypothetical protein Mgra_00003117 [Meloidogyne graminicola]|uniref:Uncharacterized protein n=1 Tax=Meloidogyne graminicola TaxID=189291 RepID=A0A8S9ZUK0_9BILA|nr:hypothetical protein Mgra_00003117 [Meloidogyne graminicola]